MFPVHQLRLDASDMADADAVSHSVFSGLAGQIERSGRGRGPVSQLDYYVVDWTWPWTWTWALIFVLSCLVFPRPTVEEARGSLSGTPPPYFPPGSRVQVVRCPKGLFFFWWLVFFNFYIYILCPIRLDKGRGKGEV